MIAEPLICVTSLGIAGSALVRMKRTGDLYPFAVFFGAYGLLFYLGALGMHYDSAGFFENWVASIGIQQVQLSPAQRLSHFLVIHSPFVCLPMGYLLADRIGMPPLRRWLELPAPARRQGVLLALLATLLALPFGTFIRYCAGLGLLLSLLPCLPCPRGRGGDLRLVFAAFWSTWCVPAWMLARAGALGSFYDYFTHFDLQRELIDRRSSLSTGLPLLFWVLAYAVLPMFCAMAMRALPGRRGWAAKAAMILANAWVIFAPFFKGPIFFYLLFLVFTGAARDARRLVKPLLAVLAVALAALSTYYIKVAAMAGSVLGGSRLLQHYLYRLGIDQFFYTAIFPGQTPFLPLDLASAPSLDAYVSYAFIYPLDALNPVGTTGGPYICSAWAQGGMVPVLVYGILVGAGLKLLWALARTLEGPLGEALQGWVAFTAFMAAQQSFRGLLFSAWGVLYGVAAAVLIQSILAVRNALGRLAATR